MSRSSLWCALFAMVCLASFSASTATAQSPDARVYVPPSLREWVPWVMESHQELSCAKREGEFLCQWPGQLTMTATKTQGTFELVASVDRRQVLCLPGGTQHWPLNVSVDGTKAVVVDEGCAAVALEKGTHRITGEFVWKQVPQMLEVPEGVGIIALNYMGAAVARPRFEEGKLWIRESGAQAGAKKIEDTARASIYRQLQDGVPLVVLTRVELNVSGRAREITLGKVLLEESEAISVESQLPLKIQGASREVKVYARPGTHQITITSYIKKNTEALKVPESTKDFFDPQEIWVWKPDEVTRSVELEGLTMVDPSRTTLPEEWRGMTTMVAKGGESLVLKTMRRGEVTTPPNQLSLSRKFWLDLDGTGFTVQDQIQGTMRQQWRLDYQESAGKLGRVRTIQDDEQLLITLAPGGGKSGVELRETGLSVEADVRMEQARSTLPAVGWDHDVDTLNAQVFLPPGWTVLGSNGVDEMPGTWLSTWDLFEIFVLVLLAMAMGKMFGWPWAIVAAVAFVLSHGHADAPRYVWFSVIAALALLRVLKDRKWWEAALTGYLIASCVVLVALFGDYAKEQLRFGVYPQIEQRYGHSSGTSFFGMDKVAPAMEQMAPEPEAMGEEAATFGDEGIGGRAQRKSQRGYGQALASTISAARSPLTGSKSSTFEQRQIAPNEVVQTGPGVPTWSWRSWDMRWNGPVAKDHVVKLWLLSPAWSFVLRALSVLALLAMLLVVLMPSRLSFKKTKAAQFDLFGRIRTLLVPMMLCGLSALALTPLSARDASAQETFSPQQAPSSPLPQGMLAELEARLLSAQACEGPCVVVPWMEIRAMGDGQVWEIDATVHAQRDTAWGIPGPVALFSPEEVRVDGIPTLRLRRAANGMMMVRVPAGIHTVSVRAISRAQDVVTLQLDPFAKTRQIAFESTGWSVDGLDEFGRPAASLQLSRKEPIKDGGEDEGMGTQAELPSWYRVERQLLLGMPWQSRTTIFREKSDRPQLLKIPLLPGEAVITEGVRVEAGEALVNLPRGEDAVSYMSELHASVDKKGALLKLKAPVGKPWTETWVLDCSRIWHCEHSGLSPVSTLSEGAYKPRWMPWPGEEVEVKVTRPAASAGKSSTVSQVMYEVTPGERRLSAVLTMEIRASQGGWQRLGLPEGAEVQSVTLKGIARNIRPEGRNLNIPLEPGTQSVQVSWTQAWDQGLGDSFPQVDLGSGAVNATMKMHHNRDRWLIWSHGPSWGPAIMFWSHLAWLLIVSLLLSRLSFLPWRTYEWFLLALGFSQLPLLALVPVVLWLFLVTWRARRAPKTWGQFGVLQLALVVSTVAFLVTLYIAIHSNLLLNVDMQVQGMGSSNFLLQWYVDRTESVLPEAGIFSVPMWIWRGVMLVWSLWLVSALFRWLPWGWRAFSSEQFWIPRPAYVPPVMNDSIQSMPGTSSNIRSTDGTPNGEAGAVQKPQKPQEPSS